MFVMGLEQCLAILNNKNNKIIIIKMFDYFQYCIVIFILLFLILHHFKIYYLDLVSLARKEYSAKISLHY